LLPVLIWTQPTCRDGINRFTTSHMRPTAEGLVERVLGVASVVREDALGLREQLDEIVELAAVVGPAGAVKEAGAFAEAEVSSLLLHATAWLQHLAVWVMLRAGCGAGTSVWRCL